MIVSDVAALFGKAPQEVVSDINEILARFIDGGLIHSSAGRRETDVLLHCVQTAIGGRSVDQVAPQIWRDVDWAYLEQTALHHGVQPLLYRGLCDIQGVTVPIDAMHRLERNFSINADRNRFLLQELFELLALFESNDVPAVPFKGPVLAIQLYGDVALREFGDLDILIPADRVARAQELLRARGCRFRSSSAVHVMAEYRTSNGTVSVDLQWAFAPKLRFPVNLERLWAGVERVDIGISSVLQPSSSDQLRMLNAHAAKHCWSRMVWICDLAVFINRHKPTLDWCEAIDAARHFGAARMVCVGACLANGLLGTVIPEQVTAVVQSDPRVGPIATEVRLRIFAPVKGHNVRGSYGVLEGALLYIRTRERLRDKLPFVWHLLGLPFRRLTTIITPNRHDRAVVALPRSVAFLYYLV